MILKNKNLYYVGGVVRDEILGLQSFDTDYCYEGNAIEFAKDLKVIRINSDFGTVRVDFDGKEIDIASTREEVYPKPGHLPKVFNIGCDLKDDLKRRDFTINAIAKNTETNELYDCFDGINDIKLKVLRVLHDKSFIDDPTRIVRGLKFSVRFGFELETKTKELQSNYLNNINYDMSYFRLKKELIETFNLNKGKAFDLFVEQGIYKLLGINQKRPDIKGSVIEKAVSETNCVPWIIYLSFFDLTNLPLTKKEKKILECADVAETKSKGHEIPSESIIIKQLRKTYV